MQNNFCSCKSFSAPANCFLLLQIIIDPNLTPYKLRGHLETKHQSLVFKPLEFFSTKLKELKTQKKVVETFSTTNCKATEASYLVVLT